MELGLSIPWWGIAIAASVAGGVAWWAYARPPVALTPGQRATLTALRLAVLLAVVFLLLRPVRTEPAPPGGVVALLIDESRSMAIPGADGVRRVDRAGAMVRDTLEPMLAETVFGIEYFEFDDSNLAGALDSVAGALSGEDVAGVVLLTDGVDTGEDDAVGAATRVGAPLHVVGLGAPGPGIDLEVAGWTAGEAAAPASLVDLTATVVAHGGDDGPASAAGRLRVFEEGRLLEARSFSASSDGTPVVERFRVPADADRPIVYTVEVTADTGDPVPGNNRRSVLALPASRERRILMVEGAPGYEHSFLKRTWQADPGLVVDAVVRKGQDDRGLQTFYVQSDPARAAALATGFPHTRADLFRYDAVVFANVEAEFFRPEQLDLAAAFVAERGGGLLLLGPSTLQRSGYAGSAMEPVLPASLVERLGLASVDDIGGRDDVRMMPTEEGLAHPMLRLAATLNETQELWQAVPPLGGTIRLGPVRPGATVLAVAPPAGGERAERPLIVAQRYGAGRSMIFAGRGAWRWRMRLPSEDRTYETWWGQAARWLTADAREPLHATARAEGSPAGRVRVQVDLRDEDFRSVRNAEVTVVTTDPAGAAQEARAASTEDPGRYVATVEGDIAEGVHLVEVTASRSGAPLEQGRTWVLVGGADPELADPWLRPAGLARMAEAGGGQYFDTSEVAELPSRLGDSAPPPSRRVIRQIWHHPLVFLLLVTLLGAEWSLRRVWGMR